MRARLQLARAHGKLSAPHALREALVHYRAVDEYVRAHGAAGMEAEAALCSEMAAMLPRIVGEDRVR